LKILIKVILILLIILYFRGDSIWFFDAPNLGQSASFKMEGTVPSRNSKNFGGFYKGFPGEAGKIEDW